MYKIQNVNDEDELLLTAISTQKDCSSKLCILTKFNKSIPKKLLDFLL